MAPIIAAPRGDFSEKTFRSGAGREGVLNFAGAEQELQGAAGNLSFDNHAVFYHAVVSRSVADVRGFQQVLELLDASFVLSLLVACCVVAAVLAQVAFLAGCIDEACDLDSLDLDAFLELDASRSYWACVSH